MYALSWECVAKLSTFVLGGMICLTRYGSRVRVCMPWARMSCQAQHFCVCKISEGNTGEHKSVRQHILA